MKHKNVTSENVKLRLFYRCRHPTPTEQSSPKHKLLNEDDSPIRSKEAYYGGTHSHMLKPMSTVTKSGTVPTSVVSHEHPNPEVNRVCISNKRFF